MTFDDFDILASYPKKFKLLIKKCLLNKHDKPVLNKTLKQFPLDFLTWYLVFTFYKKYDQFSLFKRKRKIFTN